MDGRSTDSRRKNEMRRLERKARLEGVMPVLGTVRTPFVDQFPEENTK
jgi:hypothetical protein